MWASYVLRSTKFVYFLGTIGIVPGDVNGLVTLLVSS
jgi:hypothetical protein